MIHAWRGQKLANYCATLAEADANSLPNLLLGEIQVHSDCLAVGSCVIYCNFHRLF